MNDQAGEDYLRWYYDTAVWKRVSYRGVRTLKTPSDMCVNGHPARPEFGPGHYEAVEAFLAAYPGLLQHDLERERKFGHTFAPLGHFIRT